MSADNGIYIHKFPNGWAVIHAQAIENVLAERGYNKKVLYEYYKGAKRFKTQEEAFKEAQRKYDEIMKDDFCPIVEYGIRII